MLHTPLLEAVERFRVWINPAGSSCRMRVEGQGNAQWLQQQVRSIAICPQGSSWSLRQGKTIYSFDLKYLGTRNCSDLEKLLHSLPAVEVILDRF